SEVGGVVVDVLGVVHVDAELPLELVERRMRVLLVVRVHVQRPVREAQRLRELARSRGRGGRGRLVAASAAGGEPRRNGERGPGAAAVSTHVAGGALSGLTFPSVASTTNVGLGPGRGGRRSPGAAPSARGRVFCG